MEVGARAATEREASDGASEESGAIKEEGAASSAPTSAREFAREATRTEPRLIALRT
jgi:hypothetical protein